MATMPDPIRELIDIYRLSDQGSAADCFDILCLGMAHIKQAAGLNHICQVVSLHLEGIAKYKAKATGVSRN